MASQVLALAGALTAHSSRLPTRDSAPAESRGRVSAAPLTGLRLESTWKCGAWTASRENAVRWWHESKLVARQHTNTVKDQQNRRLAVQMSRYADGAMRVGLTVPYSALTSGMEIQSAAAEVSVGAGVAEEAVNIFNALGSVNGVNGSTGASATAVLQRSMTVVRPNWSPDLQMDRASVAALVRTVRDVSNETGVPLRVRCDPRDKMMERGLRQFSFEQQKRQHFVTWDPVCRVDDEEDSGTCGRYTEEDDLWRSIPAGTGLSADPTWHFLVELSGRSWEFESDKLGPMAYNVRVTPSVKAAYMSELLPTPGEIEALKEVERVLSTSCDTAVGWKIGMLRSAYFNDQDTAATCCFGLLIPDASQLLCHFPRFTNLREYMKSRYSEDDERMIELDNRFLAEEAGPLLRDHLAKVTIDGEHVSWAIRRLQAPGMLKMRSPIFISARMPYLHHAPVWSGWSTPHWRHSIEELDTFMPSAQQQEALKEVARRLGVPASDATCAVLQSEINPE